ncbi:MAG: thiamine pyrophosphate-binding protein, partial [Nanoarchaeota archaeon]
MKVSDYIANFLKNQGIKHAFGVTGGVITPVIDSLAGKLEFICNTNEQPSAMAAEAYSRVSKNLGVAIATSGPGATNMITGIACAYFDSIPTIYLTGQVDIKDTTYKRGPRQIGFQETDIVRMVGPITKYAKLIKKPEEIRYILEKATYIAKEGRPGPVLLDLPINIQLEDINPDILESYSPRRKVNDLKKLENKVYGTMNLIRNSERPVVIVGAGVKLAKFETETRDLLEKLNIPIVLTWGAMDLLPYNHSLFIEGFGVSANRAGNYAVQNSDLILSIGARLDTRETGIKRETFAREAKKIVVAIAARELY